MDHSGLASLLIGLSGITQLRSCGRCLRVTKLSKIALLLQFTIVRVVM